MGGSSSSNFILPDVVLDFQRCIQCKKYLSCPSIKVSKTGEILCGRCVKNEEGTRSKLYEKMAEKIMFPCVNRFEGCSVLLNYDKVLKHETECQGTLFECPACPRGTYNKNSLLYLVDHYKKLHRDLILTEPVIMCKVSQTRQYLYIHCNNLVLINALYTGCTLMLKASVPWKSPALVTQRVSLFENEEKPFFESLCKPCDSFSEATSSNLVNNMGTNGFLIDNIENKKNVWCLFEFEYSKDITKLDN